MYSKEDILFKALNVNESRVERWCQKVREPMLEKIRKLPTNMTMDRLRREWYDRNGYQAKNITVEKEDVKRKGHDLISDHVPSFSI